MARATPTHSKEIKRNYVICDISGTPIIGDFAAPNYFKIDQFYAEVFIADETFILYDAAGVQKVIEIATVANITNDQLIINKTDKTISFYLTSLDEPCYTKALQFQDLNEGLFDITGDPLFDINGDRLYALKDGVTRA